ncbi:hypothetical protein VNO77_25984 [Canavalia gladiata]|uniref:Uncharacterized protein n=1 Tax=Canavalia gladiata TaxID=3824 RepID=A0AAN9Q546_CANGL
MENTRKSIVALTFLLAFFIIGSDMCKKSEARGPIVHYVPCSTNSDCTSNSCIIRDCDCQCVNKLCQCIFHSFPQNSRSYAPSN